MDLTALVLEDHPLQRSAAVNVLNRLGVRTVLQAVDGEEALAALEGRGSTIDVVLCDLRMEGMDGIEFIRHLGERGLAGGIVLTSALDDDLVATVERMARAQGVRVLGRLPKPLRSQALATLLRRYLYDRDQPLRTKFDIVEQRPLHEIRAALADGQFEPFFQPRVELTTWEVIGVEALARWRHPAQGVVSPAAFIPAMEEAGLLDELTETILGASMRCLRQWLLEGRDLSIAVNFTPGSMRNTRLPARILRLLDEHRVPPELLTVEITENALVGDLAASLETMTRLRMYGVGMSIDDFGTGYSSMTQLSRLPFSELKIDRAFVADIDTQGKNRAIVASIIKMARELGLKTTAEGAETEDEIAVLQELGCDCVQGFFFARPMSFEDMSDWYYPLRRAGSAASRADRPR